MFRVMIAHFLDEVASKSIPAKHLEEAARSHFAIWGGTSYTHHWQLQAMHHWGQSDLITLGTPLADNPSPMVVSPGDESDDLWMSLSTLFQDDKALNQDVGQHINSVADLWWQAYTEDKTAEEWLEIAKEWLQERTQDPSLDDKVVQDLLHRLSREEAQAEGL